jgi:hypothetical protein
MGELTLLYTSIGYSSGVFRIGITVVVIYPSYYLLTIQALNSMAQSACP